jgi:hypothetical protein
MIFISLKLLLSGSVKKEVQMHQATSGAMDAGRLRLRIHSGSVLARCRPEWVVFQQVQQSDSGWYEMQVRSEEIDYEIREHLDFY